MRIFVGNLASGTTSEQLLEAFSPFGRVTSAEVVKDRRTGEPKGFAFVEMAAKAEAQAAIAGLDLKELNGRSITVNEARPREERRPPRR
jgi:RNA recognition motif-containing protein